jgi:hypothetical protein
MPARVKVRAVIWVDERVVVHRVQRRGALHVTLPGGRLDERESVTDASIGSISCTRPSPLPHMSCHRCSQS